MQDVGKRQNGFGARLMSNYRDIKPYVTGIMSGPMHMKLAGAAALAAVVGAPIVAKKIENQVKKLQSKVSDAIN